MLYFIVNIFLTALTLVFLIFLICIYLSKKNMNNLENKIYRQLLLWNFIEVVSHLFLYIFLEQYRSAVPILIFSLRIYSMASVFYLFFLILYLYVVIRENTEEFEIIYLKNKNKYNFFVYLFMIITGVLQMVLPASLEVTENFYIVGGPAMVLLYVIYAPFILMTIYLIAKNRNKLPVKKVVPFYLLYLLIIIYIVVVTLNPYICALIVLFTLVSYLMFHTIENPDIKLIAELELAKNQAEKSNEAKSDFLSSMSHEIRTPLNAIVGLSQMISECDDVQEMQSDSKDILLASQNLLEIVNGILDINKLEANKMEVIESNYNPLDLFENVLRMIRIRIGSKDLELRTDFDSNLPSELYGDKEKIKQILTNLLTNAVKYTEKGFVDLNVRCKINYDKCTLTLSVKDTGRGMKEEQLPTLFTKFNRLDEDKDTNIEGTGLGLAITKSLVELLDGTIKVDTKYGVGSTFTVVITQTIPTSVVNTTIPSSSTLPTIKDKTEETIKSDSIEPISVEKTETIADKLVTNDTPKITSENSTNVDNTSIIKENINSMINRDDKTRLLLVVDDNKMNLKVASRILNDLNYQVEQAHGGLECLDMVQKNKNKYDLIFMDIMMPDLGGVETMKKLKAMEGFNTPIIALTADSMEGSREKYLAVGFDEYISKPIVKQILQETLGKYVDIDDIHMVKNGEEIPNTISSETTMENTNNVVNNNEKRTNILLVVDDNKVNLKVASRMLNDLNYQVEQAHGGLECLDMVQKNKNKYDLIFMDIMMPDLGGVETMKKLKAMEGFNTPIIALTADSMEGSREKYLAVGFDEYISKPIVKQILQETLGKYVDIDDIHMIKKGEDINEHITNIENSVSNTDTEIL